MGYELHKKYWRILKHDEVDVARPPHLSSRPEGTEARAKSRKSLEGEPIAAGERFELLLLLEGRDASGERLVLRRERLHVGSGVARDLHVRLPRRGMQQERSEQAVMALKTGSTHSAQAASATPVHRR